MTEPAIAVLPYGHPQGAGLAATPLDDLHWPLGRPARLSAGQLADLGPDDHLIAYPRTSTHFQRRRGLRAQLSLILAEPAVIHAKHHRLLRLTHRRFYRILTFNAGLLARLPNARLLPYGTTWVPDWQDLKAEKTRMCSLIASAKRDSAGHKLRHSIAAWVRQTGRDVEVMGGGYAPFAAKSGGLLRYRYSVVIENIREPNYFSEKLADAILCDCVPIYWGCPNLEQFIDPSGIIQCASEADIRRAIDCMSEADYASRRNRIRALKPAIAAYADLEKRAAETLRAAL